MASAALAQSMLAEDPFAGTVFVFRLKRADRAKILFWGDSGLVIHHDPARDIRILRQGALGRSLSPIPMQWIGIDLEGEYPFCGARSLAAWIQPI